jgi:ABC-type proline/glycine betaine transport system ATPase subunit
MWIVGIGFSLLAWHTGYTLNDKYPALSVTKIKKKEHQNEYDQQIAQVNPDKTIHKLVQELDDIIRQANGLHRISTIKEEIH